MNMNATSSATHGHRQGREHPRRTRACLEAREAGVRVLLGDRCVLAGELSDHAGRGHFDAVRMDTEWIVVVQLLGEVVQRRLDLVLRDGSLDVEHLEVEVT